MPNSNPFIFSHSGQKIGPSYPAITIEDMAVSLGRVTRFAGHGLRFWPVLIHSMIVADLVQDDIKAVALLHDASEALISDVPTPFKNKELKKVEAKILDKIFHEHLSPGLYKEWKTNPQVWKAVKIADSEAFAGEVFVVGTKALRDLYPDRCIYAEKLVRKYVKRYKVEDCISSEGLAVSDFIRKVKDAQE